MVDLYASQKSIGQWGSANVYNPSGNVRVRSEELDLCAKTVSIPIAGAELRVFRRKIRLLSLILDRKPETLRFRLSCRESDYKELREAFQRSLYG
jgi:hypothetical protein